MTAKVVSLTFDKEAVWNKARDRKSVVLDMNCWINMGDDKSSTATRVKDTLRKLVSDGLVFCPLSFGLITELYKQAEDSRLRIGMLMEELSLNVSYANPMENFAWEVERAVRRLADVGPIDLSMYGLYVPVVAYLTSRFDLELPEGLPPEQVEDFAREFKEQAESLTFTELLTMRARKKDKIFDFMRKLPAPKYSDEINRSWDIVKGDKRRIRSIEAVAIYNRYIEPVVGKLPVLVQAKFAAYLATAPKSNHVDCFGELIHHLPALHNHMELMAAIVQQRSRKDKINDFFDNEAVPVPMAYASVFVAQDKGIRDVLRNRTAILKRSPCHYCFDLAELEHWLKVEGLAGNVIAGGEPAGS